MTVRESEQGSAEVDVVKWASPDTDSEYGWLATNSDPEARIVYGEPELAAWMPLPVGGLARRSEARACALYRRGDGRLGDLSAAEPQAAGQETLTNGWSFTYSRKPFIASLILLQFGSSPIRFSQASMFG